MLDCAREAHARHPILRVRPVDPAVFAFLHDDAIWIVGAPPESLSEPTWMEEPSVVLNVVSRGILEARALDPPSRRRLIDVVPFTLAVGALHNGFLAARRATIPIQVVAVIALFTVLGYAVATAIGEDNDIAPGFWRTRH